MSNSINRNSNTPLTYLFDYYINETKDILRIPVIGSENVEHAAWIFYSLKPDAEVVHITTL